MTAKRAAPIDEENRDFKIGPSYLMGPYTETPSGPERVWRCDLLPLLASTITVGSLAHRCTPASGWTRSAGASPKPWPGRCLLAQSLRSHPSRDRAGVGGPGRTSLQTSGTLTLNGNTSKVTGKSWLDRQWAAGTGPSSGSGPG